MCVAKTILFHYDVQALQQITSSGARAALEWHMDQHDAGLVGTLCLDHIALGPQAHHRLMASHFDLASDEPSSDEDMVVGSPHLMPAVAVSAPEAECYKCDPRTSGLRLSG